MHITTSPPLQPSMIPLEDQVRIAEGLLLNGKKEEIAFFIGHCQCPDDLREQLERRLA